MSNNVIEGLQPLEPIPDISVGETIYRSLLSCKEKHPALINAHTRESITYAELLSRTCSLAEAMRSCGYGTDTTVLVSGINHLQFYVPVIASLYIGATVTTMNPAYTQTELQHVINISKPSVVFCLEDVVHKFAKIKEGVEFIERIIAIDSSVSTSRAECLNDFIDRLIRSPVSRILTTLVNTREHVVFILYSSGTTGLPKGVMLTDRNISGVFQYLSDPRLTKQNIRVLSVMPFFHGYGFITTLTCIEKNNLVVFLNGFDPKLYLGSLQDYKITTLYLAPALLVFLSKSPLVLQFDLSSVKEAFCGAAPLKKSTEEEFKQRFNLDAFRQGYGLTESALAVTLSGTENEKPKPGSSGKPVPYIRIAIRDTETGKLLGPYKQGEICIKGEMVMKGYCGDPEATKNTFTEDGWLLTGDVGYYDDDNDVFVTDRLKELIKFKGFQVAPAEIEALLLTHPEIMDSGVIGVPDERAGEIPMAFVVKLEKSSLSERDVEEFVKKRFSPQKWLRGGVKFVKDIPKNPTGKVLRRELRQMMKQYKSKL